MRLNEFIALLAADLKPWVETKGGEFHVARDPLHPYVILAGGNTKSFAAILNYVGGTALNADTHPHGHETARVELILGHGIDLRSDPGAWLYQAYGQQEPVLQLLSEIRERLLTVTFRNSTNEDSAYAENEGIEPVTLADGTPLRAFKQTVSWPLRIQIDDTAYRFLNEAPASKGATTS